MTIMKQLALILACSAALHSMAADDGKVLGVLESFDAMPVGPLREGYLNFWRWDEAKRAEAKTWSRIEVIPSTNANEGRCLRIDVSDARALAEGGLSFLRLSPFLPPEADAIRLRVRVPRGEMSIYVGGPTAYYANSDVYTEPQTIRATSGEAWSNVVLQLNGPLWRNFRRAGFSAEAPRCYYNRWAQEPMGVFLAPGSTGELLVDRIEVIALGQGRPFPVFTDDQIEVVKTLADFEDGKTDAAFTCYMAAAEVEWFEESWRRSKPLRFEPMRLKIDESGLAGRRSLEMQGRTAEEVHCAGIRVTEAVNSSGFAVTLHADAPAGRETLLGGEAVVPMDFLVFVAAPEQPFPWSSVAASDTLRAMKGPGFDYQLTHRAIAAREDLHFAVYQTRRYLKPGEWSRLVLPAADFTCIYGQGAMRTAFLDHASLKTEQVIAFACLPPWSRSNSARNAPVTLRIDQLDLVRLPGDAASHRSFWQVDDVKQLQHRDEGRDYGRTRHFWLPVGAK